MNACSGTNSNFWCDYRNIVIETIKREDNTPINVISLKDDETKDVFFIIVSENDFK